MTPREVVAATGAVAELVGHKDPNPNNIVGPLMRPVFDVLREVAQVVRGINVAMIHSLDQEEEAR